jgi:glutathione synthase/RimK-type ligase-like ATP-grasp enzyme
MPEPVVGVLTWSKGFRFRETSFYRQLFKESEELGVTLYLFTPADVKVSTKQIKGVYLNKEGTWAVKWFPWPSIVIDRFWYTTDPIFKEYREFRSKSHFPYANSRIANKWYVHEVLLKKREMHKWLPETNLYSEQQLCEMLEKHRIVYVKPINGTGGRGINKVTRHENGYHVLGRTNERKIVEKRLTSYGELCTELRNNMTMGKYIIQQGLSLDLVRDRAVDMRILIQKDGTGRWNITGMGIRVGGQNSATSNLHGGGKSLPPKVFLKRCFPKEAVRDILKHCHQLAFTTAQSIEEHFGNMMELGLDVGIDTDGQSWLVEVNPKPGREIFKHMGQLSTYKEAVQNPLKYALYLIKSSS